MLASMSGRGYCMLCGPDPIDDIDLLRNTWSTSLDPAQNPPEKRLFGSKAMINACKDYRHVSSFSRRTMLRKRVYDRVAARWTEMGFSGRAPAVLAFEPEDETKESGKVEK